MNQSDLIRTIGDILTQVDVLRSDFSRRTDTRNQLDDIREDLDGFQRQLVRKLINTNTPEFTGAAKSLTSLNSDLKRTIDDVGKVADTLNTLVQLVGVIQRIVKVII
uniref:Uncharacterized protein n=1 Tax=Candidatus Kentrum sp. UNK TaxID=2126344 RepID=A0A451AYW3_9GAMM|nr:MAG: hypothetical protein BECKUNK1418G_GA0071005_105015 [Candidatus Kentron sp. UNK]VFK71226.1 MAG: hypothetical protein BECKUNK1418H_GA0071006_105514 [Candidatus Kentron sp. UNK]